MRVKRSLRFTLIWPKAVLELIDLEQSIPLKVCSRCKQEFPATIEHFALHRAKLYCHCRACVKLDKQESHIRCKEKNNARTKKWAEDNRDHALQIQREYSAAHREEARLRSAKWYEENHEYALERDRKKRQENPEKDREHSRIFRKANRPLYNMHNRVYKAKKRAGGTHTKQELQDLYELQDGRCCYCGVPIFWHIKGDVHVDHMTPVSRGGSNTVDNLALACETCNKQKWSYTVSEWLSVRGW